MVSLGKCDAMTTVRDDVRSGDPRIDRSRITVFDVKRCVVDNDEDPHVVAGEYEIPLEDLYAALARYYEHCEALQEREPEFLDAHREGGRRSRELFESVGPHSVATATRSSTPVIDALGPKASDDEIAAYAEDGDWGILPTDLTDFGAVDLSIPVFVAPQDMRGGEVQAAVARIQSLPFDPSETEPLWLSSV
jgi:uncharacterized protein (DUF433 family)